MKKSNKLIKISFDFHFILVNNNDSYYYNNHNDDDEK